MRRLRLKHLAALAVAAGTLAVLAVGANWYAGRRDDERRLTEALAQLDADDPDWHVVGVVKAHNEAIPADDAANVTKLTLAAIGWRPGSWKARQLATASKEIPAPEWDDDRLPHDDEICSLYEVHVESGRAHGEAFAARRFPTGGLPFRFGEPDVFGTLLFDLQRIREVGNLFQDYATVEAYLGHGDEALRAAEAGLHFAEASLATEPCLISQLVRTAMCAIAVGSARQALCWSEPTEELPRLQRAFAAAADTDGMTPAARGERAATMRVFDNMRSGTLPADYLESTDASMRGGSAQSDFDALRLRLSPPNRVRQQAALLKLHNGLVAAMKLRGPARRAACDAALDAAGPDIAKMTPSVSNCVKSDDRLRACLLNAAVGMACERYRRQFGHFPATLADIPASILPSIPEDPFNGQPLGYRVLEDGATVYSVGPDGRHRGTPDETVSVRDSQIYSFRLWNTEHRRRPPLPRPEPDTDADELLDKPGEP